jgi:hypothetical protein
MSGVGTALTDPARRLYGIPPVGPYEPFSCWAGRLALSQGVKLTELEGFARCHLRGDIDFRIPPEVIRTLVRACGLPAQSFELPLHIFGALAEISSDGEPFLLRAGGRPRFRLCAECLRCMRTPYLPLHWRFDCWHRCPLHSCLLEDRCPHCGAFLIFPVDQLSAGPGREGVAYLSQCMACGRLLTDCKPVVVEHLEGFGEAYLENGRAVLAALFAGYLHCTDSEGRQPLQRLMRLHKQRFIPSGSPRKNPIVRGLGL